MSQVIHHEDLSLFGLDLNVTVFPNENDMIKNKY
jgi:hypothetical protein